MTQTRGTFATARTQPAAANGAKRVLITDTPPTPASEVAKLGGVDGNPIKMIVTLNGYQWYANKIGNTLFLCRRARYNGTFMMELNITIENISNEQRIIDSLLAVGEEELANERIGNAFRIVSIKS